MVLLWFYWQDTEDSDSKSNHYDLFLKISKLETEKFELEKKYQDVNISYIQLKKQLSKDEVDGERVTARLQTALNSEAQARSQVRRLEAVVAAHESRVSDPVIHPILNWVFHHFFPKPEFRLACYNNNAASHYVEHLVFWFQQTSGVVERENFQLNSENKNLQEKLRNKEREIRELEEKVNAKNERWNWREM